MNRSIEDYIKNIYSIKQAVGKVTTTTLADNLSVSPAAVSEMVSKLSKSGYIKNTPYKGFELTKKGDKVALNLIRKHRLWEVFLVKHLHFPWDKVHDEAEKLEHVSTDELITKLEDFMEFPKYDPHGHPIPDQNGKMEKDDCIPLTKAEIGSIAIIKKVSDQNSEVLNYLTKIGLKLNEEIKITDRIDFDNSVHILKKSGKIFLSEKLAGSIYVKNK
jgi:DtxR family Mn-dependent transcriptional regulator